MFLTGERIKGFKMSTIVKWPYTLFQSKQKQNHIKYICCYISYTYEDILGYFIYICIQFIPKYLLKKDVPNS